MTHSTETEAETVRPFGDRLSEKRRSLGLTLEELARTLNLNINILEALEKSEIEKLPPAIYVQGYIKAYTKALGISSEEIHADFLKTVESSQAVELPTPSLPSEASSDTPIVKAISILFVVLALAAVIFGIYNYYSNKVEVDATSPVEVTADKTLVIPQLDEEATVENDEVSADAEIAVTSKTPVDAVIEEYAVEEVVIDEEETVATKNVIAEDVSANEDTLMIRATSESWAEIRGDDKKRIYFGMLKTDDILVLSGKAPFDVFLGNALHVNLAVNDIDVDMSGHIRANNVAHFKVSESSNQIVFH